MAGLVDELRETLVDRAHVLRALARGQNAPFDFDDTLWACPDVLK